MPAGYLIVGQGRPWRIPGPVPSVPDKPGGKPALIPLGDWLRDHPEDQYGHCGNPDCKDYHDHAPDQEIPFTTPPAVLPAALAVKTGGGH